MSAPQSPSPLWQTRPAVLGAAFCALVARNRINQERTAIEKELNDAVCEPPILQWCFKMHSRVRQGQESGEGGGVFAIYPLPPFVGPFHHLIPAVPHAVQTSAPSWSGRSWPSRTRSPGR